MKIFITGASGFVGGHIVRRLSNQYQFLAMARSENSAQKVEEYGATAVKCELGSVKKEHLENCDLIIHAAAFTKEWGTKEAFFKTTVEGTRQLLAVAKEAGVKKFIQISTEAILFTGQDLNNIDESYPYPSKSKFLYSESKLEAEKIALAMNDEAFDVSVIRPRLVWGPGDQAVLPVVIKMIEEKKFMWVNGGTNETSHTHIYNLVHSIDCLIKNWKKKEVYFVTDGETNSYKVFFTEYLKTQGIEAPNKAIPKWLIRSLSVVVEGIWKTLRIKNTPPMTRLPAYMLSSNFTISHKKAEQQIDYQPIIDFNTGMKELAAESSFSTV